MHPRMLAKNGCSGGTCPAVYDDLAGQPDDLAIVGTKASADLLAALEGKVAPDEVVGTIKRSLVKAALRPAAEPVTPAELQAQFETFAYSAYRQEALQAYAGTGRDDQWITLLKANLRWGKTHQRVHVVTEPLTPAMQEELTDGYTGNVAAGEDIRIIAAAGPGDWPLDLPRADFWIFDSSRLYEMHYDLDGTWAGAVRVRDPERIVEACRARDAALHRAIPWRDYIVSRPDLKRRLAR